MKRDDPEIELTPEQEAEAAYIEDILAAKAQVEVRYMARLMASKPNRELLGATEFQLRDAVHRLGASGVDAALKSRNTMPIVRDDAKPGTRDPVVSAPTARKTRSSSDTPTSP